MYREEISTEWKGCKNSMHLWKLSFITSCFEGQTKQKRRLVAKKRLGAGLAMGGLGIQPIENTVQGFQQNLLQKIYKRVNQTANGSLLPLLLNRLLLRVHRPSLEDHVERLGPQQWKHTTVRLEQKNKMFAQAFRAIGRLLQLYEVDKDGWHHAPIFGHKSQPTLPIHHGGSGIVMG